MTNLEQNDLSDREIEILKLVATGVSNKEIAHKLVISPNTVKVHLRNIFTKIGAASRTEAAMFAVNNGFIKTSSGSNQTNKDGFPEDSAISRKSTFGWIKENYIILFLGFLLVASLIFVLGRNLYQDKPELTPINQTSEIDSNWQSIENMPVPRYAFASTVYEKRIYVLGGVSDSGITDSVVSFDLETRKWQQQEQLLVPVSEIKETIINGKIYIPGGKTTEGSTTNKLQVFDTLTGKWSEKESLPISLSGYAMSNIDGILFIFGGWDGSDVLDTVFSYNPETDQWTQRTNLGIKRVYAEAVSITNKILVIGGFDGKVPLDLTDAYIPQNDSVGLNPWQSKTPLPKPLFGMGATSIGDFVYIAGGAENDQLLFYSETQNLWQNINASSVLQTEFPGMSSTENYIYVFGGRNNENRPVSQFASYKALYIVQIPIITK